MTVSLTVLGCSGSYAGPGQACSGYLVRSPEVTVAVDLGPGTLANLQHHVSLDAVDALVLTHEHPDHWLELPVLRNALRYYLGREHLPVYGTRGTHARAEAVVDGLAPTLEWTAIGPTSEVEVGDLRLRFSRTDHPVETLAVRVDAGGGSATGGRSLVYSADTGPEWSDPHDLVRGADLFVCEATIPAALEGSGAPHLSGREAGRLAATAGVGRLVLTHLAPGVDEDGQRRDAQGAFGGPVDVARIGATFTV